MNQTAASLSNILGPIIGGVVFGFFSIQSFFLLNSITFFLAVVVQLFIVFDLYKKEMAESKEHFLTSIKEGFSYVSTTLKCRTGSWFTFYGLTGGISLFLLSFTAILTNSLYFKPIFINTGSDLLKKTNSFPDTVFIFSKILVNLLFISDNEHESEHWYILFILIVITGTNAYYNLYYQNRANKSLNLLNNIFSLVTLLAYLSLLIGKVFKSLEFTGTIYLFFSDLSL